MNKLTLFLLTSIACVAVGCAPSHHWQIHGSPTCQTPTGELFRLNNGSSVSVIVHQSNGKSKVIYMDHELTCPTTNVWIK